MAEKPFEQYQDLVNEFNNKYGVSFSFSEYETSQLKLNHIANSFSSDARNSRMENNLYRGTLLNLYKEYAVRAFFAIRCDDSDNVYTGEEIKSPSNFVKDFDKLMDCYRDYCKNNGRKAPNKFGGWKSGIEIMDSMKARVGEIGNGENDLIDKTDYAKKEYLAGRLPLRKMRAHTEMLKGSPNPSTADAGRLITYLRALDKVMKERSFLSKLNPFNWPRMHAEKRDYAAINNAIVEYAQAYPDGYESAIAQADSKATPDPINDSIDDSIENIKALEQEKERAKSVEKETVNFNDDLKEKEASISKAEKIEEKEPIDKQITFNN